MKFRKFWCQLGQHSWRLVDTIIGHKNGWEWDILQCEDCGKIELGEV